MFAINEKGEFNSEFIIKTSQVVEVNYEDQKLKIYIEPGEKIGLLQYPSNDGLKFKYFEKKNEKDNAIYEDYQNRFGYKTTSLPNSIFIPSSLYNSLKDLSNREKYNLLRTRYKKEVKYWEELDREKI